jgi:hypothetical protein
MFLKVALIMGPFYNIKLADDSKILKTLFLKILGVMIIVIELKYMK